MEPDRSYVLLEFTTRMTIAFKLDGMGKVFAGLIAFLWPFAMLYAFEYMEHEPGENSFFGQYLLSYAMTLVIASAQNLFTLYFFFESLTLATVFLVAHGFSHRSVYAARKYLYYSLGAASLGFLSMISVLVYSDYDHLHFGRHPRPAAGAAHHDAAVVRAGLFRLRGKGRGVPAARLAAHGLRRAYAGDFASARGGGGQRGRVFGGEAGVLCVRPDADLRHLGADAVPVDGGVHHPVRQR